MTLPPVKFSKVSQDHAQALQSLVVEYIEWQSNDLKHQMSARFYDAIQQTAVLLEAYLILRTKIESRKQNFSLSFKVQQAVAILSACSHSFKKDQSYRDLVALTYIDAIQRQLISIKTLAPEHENIYKIYLNQQV